MTPTTATASDAGPARNISRRSVSRPISNSSSSTPSSARTCTSSPATPSCGTIPSTLPPSSTPATSSPRTAGWPIRSASSPSNFAATRMAARARKNPATSTLQRLLGPRSEREGLLQQREVHALAVFSVDDDPAIGPLNPEPGWIPQPGVGMSREPALDDVVGVLPGEDRLLPHVVQQLVVAPVDPA